jgi:hypothetical protein
MAKCYVHKGRDAVPDVSFFGKKYCEKCVEQIKKAQSKISGHVTPRDCFFWYTTSGWEVPRGTGCAHWVAHQKGIKSSFNSCAEGYAFRVPDVISGARKIDRESEDVKVGDIWEGKVPYHHCGLVVKVEQDGETQKVTIRHCSSGQGGVITSDFATYFKGKGNFWRR